MMATLLKRQFRMSRIWMPFILLLVNACQPAPTAPLVPQPTHTQIPIIEPTLTETAIPLPTFELPTVTPVPTEVTSLLTLNGPWLVYLHNSPRPAMMDIAEVPAEFVLLNQDGSGRTAITLPCSQDVNTFLMDSGNSTNYLARYAGGLYLFRPSAATGMVVRGMHQGYPVCQHYFRGDEKGGLLASFYQASNDVSPELILYELPSGRIRERFPLVRCSNNTNVCEKYRSNWPEMMRQRPRWSPNGRYLAFVSILDATSSDLFVYDTQDGKLRRLTNGPDWVGPIEWSPDGTQIIMQEILNDSEFLFDPYSKAPASVWSVSVSTNEIRLLYSTGNAYTIQNILFWLDDKRFIAYEGFLVNADQARGLRLVDMEAGTDRILFKGVFVMIRFDPVHEVFAIYEQNTELCLPNIICLVSMKDGTIRPLEGPPTYMSFPNWDENTGMFVSSSDCENDPQSLQAFNYQGTLKCVPKPTLTPTVSVPLEIVSYRAPNGKWTTSAQDGLWLESEGQTAVQISQETATDVIWCPNSNCFFFSVLQQNQQWTLYHVSLPDLIIKLVDEGIESNSIYQWLGSEK